MRFKCVLIAIGMSVPGAAQASSFVSIAPPPAGASPSFVTLGAQKPVTAAVAAADPAPQAADASLVPLAFPLPDGNAPAPRIISPSIVAYGPTMPAVTFEQVAAIKAPAEHWPRPTPVVIRAGITDAARQPAEAVLPASAPGKATAKSGRPQPGSRKTVAARSDASMSPTVRVTSKAEAPPPEPAPLPPTPDAVAPPKEMLAPQ